MAQEEQGGKFSKGNKRLERGGSSSGGRYGNTGRTGNAPITMMICFQCGKVGHTRNNCPMLRQQGPVPNYITCFRCGEQGHYSNNCPRNQPAPLRTVPPPASEPRAIEPAPKRPTIAGRVYTLGVDNPEPLRPSQGPITGTLRVGGSPTHVLFDSGANHSFMSSIVARNLKGTYETIDIGLPVITPGDQILQTQRCVMNVPIEIGSETLYTNLLVIPLGRHKVILGMDWLSKYNAHMDCERGRIAFERDVEPIIKYHGIKPCSGASFVAALRVEEELANGEAYLIVLSMIKDDKDKEQKLEEISVVCEYEDVFKPLEGLPPPRSNPFTITLEPGAAPIARAPYRMAPQNWRNLRSN